MGREYSIFVYIRNIFQCYSTIICSEHFANPHIFTSKYGKTQNKLWRKCILFVSLESWLHGLQFGINLVPISSLHKELWHKIWSLYCRKLLFVNDRRWSTQMWSCGWTFLTSAQKWVFCSCFYTKVHPTVTQEKFEKLYP